MSRYSPVEIKRMTAFKKHPGSSKAFKRGIFGASDGEGFSTGECWCPRDCTSCQYDAGYVAYFKANGLPVPSRDWL